MRGNSGREVKSQIAEVRSKASPDNSYATQEESLLQFDFWLLTSAI
jgi:hypothetical protein